MKHKVSFRVVKSGKKLKAVFFFPSRVTFYRKLATGVTPSPRCFILSVQWAQPLLLVAVPVGLVLVFGWVIFHLEPPNFIFDFKAAGTHWTELHCTALLHYWHKTTIFGLWLHLSEDLRWLRLTTLYISILCMGIRQSTIRNNFD